MLNRLAQASADATAQSNEKIIGHGLHWLGHFAYIQLDVGRLVPDFVQLEVITHDIGKCEATGYFNTGTCLKTI